MSSQNVNCRITVPDIMTRKGQKPIVCLTAYHTHIAKIIDPYVEVLLVGDSLGMVLYGLESTLSVTLDMMIMHGQAVMRGSKTALVVVDMPFGSYEESPSVAFRNASEIMSKTGCQAVKIEGGEHMAETISYLSQRGIPVMAHIGLMPQSMNVLGGFKRQGSKKSQWTKIKKDADYVTKAGAFCLVLEGVHKVLADEITESVKIPTIGIGASQNCDGQILVTEDMLGISAQPPRFVKVFGSLSEHISTMVDSYACEVREGTFPSDEYVYHGEVKDDEGDNCE